VPGASGKVRAYTICLLLAPDCALDRHSAMARSGG
jgi:hypothetical protein